MKHTLFAVLATTALTLSAPAFAAATKLDNNATTNNGKAVEAPGTVHSGSGANGSPAEMNPNGSSSGSSSEINNQNCVSQSQLRGLSQEDKTRLQSQGMVCQPGMNGESGGAIQHNSPSGSSRSQGNFDKDH